MTVTFDSVHYKETTRAQWQNAATAWHAWGPTLEHWLGETTTVMLDAAGITTGSTVLDVAAGAGGQSLAAARRVGPSGQVLATDISPAILAHAATAAAAAGLTTVQTRELDGEALDVDAAAFDAVISRLGLIYFPDQPRALGGWCRTADASMRSAGWVGRAGCCAGRDRRWMRFSCAVRVLCHRLVGGGERRAWALLLLFRPLAPIRGRFCAARARPCGQG